jgi:hypothetical protein
VKFVDAAGRDYGIPRRRGETDMAYYDRIHERIAQFPIAGSRQAIRFAAEDVLPADVMVSIVEGPRKVVVKIHERWWRRLLFFPARSNRNAVVIAVSRQIACGVIAEVRSVSNA